jgi:cation transport ATPase
MRTERFILTIEGLSCACCEDGIAKAIDQIPSIQRYQINLVMARLEIDLEINQNSIGDIIKKLHSATGYKFEEYSQPEGQILELLVDDSDEVRRAKQPRGVTLLDMDEKQFWSPIRIFSGRNSVVPAEARAVSPASRDNANESAADRREGKSASAHHSFHQHTVRIHYDAKIIGARDIVHYYQELLSSLHIELASPTTHPSLAIGAKQIKGASIVFLITLMFTLPVLVFAWAPVQHERMVYEHISLALATVVQAIGLREFSPAAFRSLFRFRLFGMDLLITLSTTIAYVFSVVSYVFQVLGRPPGIELRNLCRFARSKLRMLFLSSREVLPMRRKRKRSMHDFFNMVIASRYYRIQE